MSTPAQPSSAPADPSNQPATPPAPEGTAPTPPEPAAPATPPAPAPGPPAEPTGKTPKFEGDFDPARFEKLVENLRGDVAAEKAKREADAKAFKEQAEQQQADLLKKVATAFGLNTGTEEQPPTLEGLAKELEESRGETKASRDETRQTKVELAVYKSAGKHGGDPDALLDSRGFAQNIAKLDPSAPDFAASVEKAVKAAVEANSKLAAVKPAEPKLAVPAGGAPMDGAPGQKRQLGAEDVARMTPDQIVKAKAEGRLTSYLGGGR